MTATWVVEATFSCNLILEIEETIARHQIDPDSKGDREDRSEINYFSEPESETEETDRSFLIKSNLASKATYGALAGKKGGISEGGRHGKLEMAEMAEILFNKAGRVGFSVCMLAYLYGDLAIYCTAIAKSLVTVTC